MSLSDDIPSFDSHRIDFTTIPDRSKAVIHYHKKILLLDGMATYSVVWKEHIEDENRCEPEPGDYEVYQYWLTTLTFKSNGGIYSD